MSTMFEQTIFPPIEKPKNVSKSNAGGFEYWFSKIDNVTNLMVKCPECDSIFCLEKNVYNERNLRIGIQNQGYYFLNLIRSKCNGCKDREKNMMYG